MLISYQSKFKTIKILVKSIVFIAFFNTCVSSPDTKSVELENFTVIKNFILVSEIEKDKNEDRFFEPDKKLIKLFQIEQIKEQEFLVNEISLHFFSYQNSFLDKIKKESKLNLKKFFLLTSIKSGIGTKKSKKILSVELNQISTKTIQGNSLKELMQKYTNQNQFKTNFFLEKKNLILYEKNLSIEDETIYTNKNSIYSIPNDTNEDFNFVMINKNVLEIFQDNSHYLEFNLSSDKKNLIQNQNIEIYEHPIILYKK